MMSRRTLVAVMALCIIVMAGGGVAARQHPQDVGRLSGPIPSIHFDSLEAALKYNPLLTTLHKALNATDLFDHLNNDQTVATIIAPTNSAFKLLLKKLGVTEDELLHSKKLLTRVLSYHVIPDLALKSSDLNDGESEETLLDGQFVTFHKEAYLYFLTKITITGDPAARPATVLVADVEAAKTVVHVVNRVLLPEDDDQDDDDGADTKEK